jgi:hypothetical protein
LDVVVVFFAVVVFALPASAFFGAGAFLAVAVLDVVGFFAAAGFVAVALDLVVVVFVGAVFLALGFAVEALGLAAGLFCDTND